MLVMVSLSSRVSDEADLPLVASVPAMNAAGSDTIKIKEKEKAQHLERRGSVN